MIKCEIKVDRMEKNESERRGVHGYERIEKERKEMKRQGAVSLLCLL